MTGQTGDEDIVAQGDHGDEDNVAPGRPGSEGTVAPGRPGGEDPVAQGERGEQGDRRSRVPGWLPSWRPSLSVAVGVALVAGLAVGYTAGDRNGRDGAARSTSQSSSSASPASASPASAATSPSPSPASDGQPTFFMFADSTSLTQDTGACSTQTGQRLELGVQITNQSPQTLTLQSVVAKLPLGGLKQVADQWATCGALPSAVAPGQVDVVLLPGASTWLTVTFQVKVACPAPYPVQFTVGYRKASGAQSTVSLPGFPDLGQVPYNGCPVSSADGA
jgi:hypothetical protein